jgi:5'-nucleotidase
MALKRVLLTNDDGVDALGLSRLYESLSDLAQVWMVAPRYEQSGAGHSFSPRKPLLVERLAPRCYCVDGTPTDCVLLAHHALMRRRIDLVVAGMNQGLNLGEDITYSGTVAGAIEGAILGIPSLAVSLASPSEEAIEVGAGFTRALVARLLKLPRRRVFLNINIPVPINGVRVTRLGTRLYNDKARRVTSHLNKTVYLINGNLSCRADPGSDCQALAQGMVSITPLHLDLTDYARLNFWRHFIKDFVCEVKR